MRRQGFLRESAHQLRECRDVLSPLALQLGYLPLPTSRGPPDNAPREPTETDRNLKSEQRPTGPERCGRADQSDRCSQHGGCPARPLNQTFANRSHRRRQNFAQRDFGSGKQSSRARVGSGSSIPAMVRAGSNSIAVNPSRRASRSSVPATHPSRMSNRQRATDRARGRLRRYGRQSREFFP